MQGIALYDCTANDPSELSFLKGDNIVDIKESKEDGWYFGRIKDKEGESLLIPKNYVELKKLPPPLKPKPKPKNVVVTSKDALNKVSKPKPPPKPASKSVSIKSNKHVAHVNEIKINDIGNEAKKVTELTKNNNLKEKVSIDKDEDENESKILSIKERMALFENDSIISSTSNKLNEKIAEPILEGKEKEKEKENKVVLVNRIIPEKPKQLNKPIITKSKMNIHEDPFKTNLTNIKQNKEDLNNKRRSFRPAPPPPNKETLFKNRHKKSLSVPKNEIIQAPKLPSRTNTLNNSIELKSINTSQAPKLPSRNETIKGNSNPLTLKISQIPDKSKQRYIELFYKLSENDKDKIPTYKIIEIFLLSKLDVETLAKVWDLCDINQTGFLDKCSFIVALYIIDQRLLGHKIPNQL